MQALTSCFKVYYIKGQEAVTMSIAKEIREEQKKALSTMNTREKLAYFWEYYKIHTIAAIIIIAVVISLIRQYVTSKDIRFYAVLMDAVTTDSNSGLSEVWSEEFLEYAQIDAKEYDVYIDTSISIATNTDVQYLYANQQKLFALFASNSISAFVADTQTFEEYAQLEYFYDLKSLLSEEELNKYGPYLYYTDASTFGSVSDISFDDESSWEDPGNLIINHRDPSTMKQPVAVGVILSEDNKLADAGYYAYLRDAGYEYQGYPSDAVLGVPLMCEEPELVIRFLEYLQLGN